MPVTARRIPRDRVPAASTSATHGDNSREQYPFVRISDYEQLGHDGSGISVEPESSDDPADPGPGADPGPAGVESVPVEDSGAAVDPVDDDEQHRPGWRERSRVRSAARRTAGYRHPLL